jgi:nucleoside-diphosphate-sugar epimerase
VRRVPLDLSAPISLDERVDIVFHVAGEIYDERRMLDVNGEGTRRLVDWAVTHEVRRFVYVSTVGVFRARKNAGRVTEDARKQPASTYARSKKLAEDHVVGRCSGVGMDFVILQPANVLGAMPGRPPQLLSLMRAVKNGSFSFLGSGTVYFNFVAAEAVARGIAAAMSPQLANQHLILNTPVDLRSVVGWIAEELGVRPVTRTLPRSLGYLAGLLSSAATKVASIPVPFSYARYCQLTMHTYYDGNRIIELAGFRYSPDLESTIRSIARRYRDEGLL